MEETSKYGVLGRHQPCSEERIEVLSDTIERNHPLRHASSLLYPEGYHDEIWRSHIREVFVSPLPPPKISFKDNWMKELGSEVAGGAEVVRQPEGEVVQQSKSSQSSQPNPNPDHDRTGKPVVCRDANHERSMLNEVDIDFRIPGLTQSVVKQADNYRVRELVKKIENHPDRHALQRDLQQNKAYNPFSTT